MLKTACAEAASWATPLKVSVNVSPIQLMNTSLTDTIIEVLHPDRPRIRDVLIWRSPSRTYSMRTPVRWKFSASCAVGIQISIDDFGTGYSSLSRLATSRSIKLKSTARLSSIFRNKRSSLDIVRLIISMGKSLHMRIVAEGVEAEEQLLASLQALGCDLVQVLPINKPKVRCANKFLTCLLYSPGRFQDPGNRLFLFLLALIPARYKRGRRKIPQQNNILNV
ncbi:EAL domain-containing protein [Klebsiella pneumoniae]|nr:EAL domain-containing protein [Klebsiella pneumoniae]